MNDLDIRPISVDEARPLREDILRPGQPVEAVTYPGDNSPETLHVGVFVSKQLIGVASVFLDPSTSKENSNTWRLRGMAVREHFQRQGIGQAMLEVCLSYIKDQGGTSLWCNARTPVMGFYKSLGFISEGEEFEIPGAGPHYFMWLPIE